MLAEEGEILFCVWGGDLGLGSDGSGRGDLATLVGFEGMKMIDANLWKYLPAKLTAFQADTACVQDVAVTYGRLICGRRRGERKRRDQNNGRCNHQLERQTPKNRKYSRKAGVRAKGGAFSCKYCPVNRSEKQAWKVQSWMVTL